MFLRVLTATFLPSRSFADFRALPFLTTTAPKSAPSLPVEPTPFATTLMGTPVDWAIIKLVELENPNWNWPLTTPGTMAAPPCAVVIDRVRPCFLKKPCLWPR
ncbi:hypothetical protein K377_02563 [Streptomyces sp. PsTaAH-137]|nr:hypothetical protein K377_02563 [Streptomyces sp. PsTaAH-137]